MRFARPLAAAVLVIMFAAPVMACLLPETQLTPAERQCCRRMAHQCGNMNGPGTHSCCKPIARTGTFLALAYSSVTLNTCHADLPVWAAPIAAPLRGYSRSDWDQVAHPPPQAAVNNPILRI